MKRKLASVQTVRELRPIEKADAIELALVLGWQVVVKKGEFRAGDRGIFFEVDAVPPRLAPFEFLWKGRDNPDKVRVTTMRLRGQLSQGLMLPLATLGEVLPTRDPADVQAVLDAHGYGDTAPADLADALQVGDDLTDLLGVQKYDKVVSADARGPFPAVIPQTDEMRLQSFPALLDEMAGREYVMTIKLDGTSATFLIDPFDGTFHACSRGESVVDTLSGPGKVASVELRPEVSRDGSVTPPRDNWYWRAARRYNIPDALATRPHLAIQGEVVGPGIQGNKLGLPDTDFRAFNVYHISEARYLSHDEAAATLAEMGVPMVPLLERGPSFAFTQADLLARAEGKYDGTTNEREGIVVRPAREMRSAVLGDRLSFKVLSNRFLLAGG